MRIRSLFHAPTAHFFFSIPSSLHFRSPCFGGSPWRCSTRFWCFWTSFCHFYAHLTEPIMGFTFWMHLVDWAVHFCGFYWLGTTPTDGVSSFYMIKTIFVDLKLSKFVLFLSFHCKIRKLGFMMFCFIEFRFEVFNCPISMSS